MKKILSSILFLLLLPLTMSAQGWPDNYGGVMLQGFWWDSYQQTRWTTLERQADEMSQYFDLIWVPQSGYCNATTMQMGYSDIWWLDHKSAFGTEAELRQMIKTFKEKGTGIIEDVVINHKNGNSSWCDFPNESKNGYTLTWDNDTYSAICVTDECNSSENLSKWGKGQKTTGARDTGDDFGGCRDLDHTNAQVQQNVKTYLSFLLNDLGYTGFRYDMVKGFSPTYVSMYNTTVNPAFSVGECWDGNVTVVKNWIDGTRSKGVIQSAAFDFPMKYQINRAFQNGQWTSLKNAMLTTTDGYSRYAVTFVDNHDTGKNPAGSSDGPLGKNVCAANAYILAMPGTPCLWLKHWQDYRGSLKRLIAARRAAGVTNSSTIVSAAVVASGFVLTVQGNKGKVMLVLGEPRDPVATNGYQLAVEGVNYKYYVSNGTDLSAVKAVTDVDGTPETPVAVVIPPFCTVSEGETCAFFEAPPSWGDIKCWRWDNSYNYTSNRWPGVDCTLVGTAENGNKVWKWSWNGQKTPQTSPNQGIIFNDGSNQTADLDFENAGYYTLDGLQGNVLLGVEGITVDRTGSGKVYDLSGRHITRQSSGRQSARRKGIVIVDGKKRIAE